MDDDPIITKLKELGGPITRDRYIFLNWFGTPPDELTAEDLDEIPDYPWDDETDEKDCPEKGGQPLS